MEMELEIALLKHIFSVKSFTDRGVLPDVVLEAVVIGHAVLIVIWFPVVGQVARGCNRIDLVHFQITPQLLVRHFWIMLTSFLLSSIGNI